MKKKITLKQIVAASGILLLLGMYVISLLLAIFAKPEAGGMFMASVAATILVPVGMYGLLLLVDLRKKNKEEGMSASELRKYNKRLANGESAEDLAKEIEEKYGIADEEEEKY